MHDSLTNKATVLLVHALITSKLDYCNSFLHGSPDKLINRLQRLQNIAAGVVSRTSKFKHITPAMYELNWLPVRITAADVSMNATDNTYIPVRAPSSEYKKNPTTTEFEAMDLIISTSLILRQKHMVTMPMVQWSGASYL